MFSTVNLQLILLLMYTNTVVYILQLQWYQLLISTNYYSVESQRVSEFTLSYIEICLYMYVCMTLLRYLALSTAVCLPILPSLQ